MPVSLQHIHTHTHCCIALPIWYRAIGQLRESETRNVQLQEEYGRLRSLVEPQTATMENIAAELKAALEREQISREEAGHYRAQCIKMDSTLAAVGRTASPFSGTSSRTGWA